MQWRNLVTPVCLADKSRNSGSGIGRALGKHAASVDGVLKANGGIAPDTLPARRGR